MSGAEPVLDASVLRIDGEMTIYRAAELQALLSNALHGAGDALEVDLSQVTDFDTAGVQLLMAAKTSARQADKALRLTGHSPAVLGVFDAMDLAGHFGDPLLVPAARH